MIILYKYQIGNFFLFYILNLGFYILQFKYVFTFFNKFKIQNFECFNINNSIFIKTTKIFQSFKDFDFNSKYQ